MATHRSHRKWLLSDAPRAGSLFIWLTFGMSVAFYASDWPRGGQERLAAAREPVEKHVSDAERYSGSIIIAARAEDCWQRMLDNRTGKMWDVGLVNCEEAISQAVQEQQAGSWRAKRIRAIGKAFTNDDN